MVSMAITYVVWAEGSDAVQNPEPNKTSTIPPPRLLSAEIEQLSYFYANLYMYPEFGLQ